MLDFLFTAMKTIGWLLSLGFVGLVFVLFVLGLMKRLPWVIVAPAMAGLAALASYSTGMMEGIKSERVAWQTERQKLLDIRAMEKAAAASALRKAAEDQLSAEEKIDDLSSKVSDGLAAYIAKQRNENKDEICLPFDQPVSPDLLRVIEGSTGNAAK